MDARDFRSIGRAAPEETRRRALVLIARQGLTQAQAAEVVGVERQTVNAWLKRYRAQGEAGVMLPGLLPTACVPRRFCEQGRARGFKRSL